MPKSIVIPSSLNGKYLREACEAKSEIVLLSGVNIGNLGSFVEYIHAHHKKAYIHIDITGGFRPDEVGIQLLKNMFHLDGVISTNMHALTRARAIKLETIYRLFLFDSRSLERAAGAMSDGQFSAI